MSFKQHQSAAQNPATAIKALRDPRAMNDVRVRHDTPLTVSTMNAIAPSFGAGNLFFQAMS